MASVTIEQRPVTSLQTDACSIAVGASYDSDWFYSNFLVDNPSLSCLHINYKEAICVILAACRWACHWQNKSVHVYCDSTAAVGMLNKGSTRSPLMMDYLRVLFWLSATFNFRLKAYHIPGHNNVVADHVSRLHEPPHLLAFYNHLSSLALDPSVIPALSHMSPLSYFYVLGSVSCRD